MYYLLCILNTLFSAIDAEYKVFDESGSLVGSFQDHTRIVKRDTVNPGTKTIVSQDDHTYYNLEVFTNSSGWVEINPELSKINTTLHDGLSSDFRKAYNISLPFTFPFYGVPLTSIILSTGGFIYVGEIMHNQLTATQYIAPLMAEFNPSLSNDSHVYYHTSDTRAIVQWDNVYVHSHRNDNDPEGKDQPFTFQAQLYINGDIIFAYKKVPFPVGDIDDKSHYVKVGIAEAFYEVDTSHGITVTFVHEYHKVEVPFEYIKVDTEVVLSAQTTCATAQSCTACATLQTAFNCSWCPTVQQCSDGTFRWNQNWTDAKCNEPNRSLFTVDQCLDYNKGKDEHENYSGAKGNYGTSFALVLLVYFRSLMP